MGFAINVSVRSSFASCYPGRDRGGATRLRARPQALCQPVERVCKRVSLNSRDRINFKACGLKHCSEACAGVKNQMLAPEGVLLKRAAIGGVY